MKKRRLIIILIISLALLAGAGAFFAYKYFDTLRNDADYQATQLVQHVEKFIAVPDEDPTVATVVDRDRLNNELLRSSAQNGDKLLIYSDAKKVILYRPSWDKVIQMLTIESTQTDLAQ